MRLTLLAYLAAARPRGFHSRDRLLGLLWPDVEQEAARNRLRQALHHVRRSLGDDVVISRGDRELGVDDALFTCDAAQFDDAIASGRYEDALALYRGDFLAGFFVDDAPEAERWIEEERAFRRRAAIDAALTLASREEARGEARAAIPWTRTALSLAPHDEGALRMLMGLLHATGDTASALVVFEEFERRLSADLDMPPSAETRALAATLTADRAAPVPAAQTPVVTAAVTSPGNPVIAPAAPASSDPGNVYREVFDPVAISYLPRRPGGRPRRGLRARVLAVGLLVVAGLGAGGWFALDRRAPSPVTVPTIAVLPFVDMSGDSANAYFSDGVTEEILNTLARVDGLRVASRGSSFTFKGKSVDVREVGGKLGVGSVLEGSVRRAGSRIRISAQLINVADGLQIWSETYDREIHDIFALQDEIARSIASALQLRLGRAGDDAAERRMTTNAEAYDLYLRGKYLYTSTSEERNRKAIEYFEQAIARDPRFALPYAGLARAYIYMGEYDTPRLYLPKAKQAALRALQLDSSLVETRLALANVRQVYDRDWDAAEREFLRAIEFGPKSAQAHAAYAIFLLNSKRFDEALVERRHSWDLRRATAPDTMLPAFRLEEHLSWAGYYAYISDHRRALDHARSALALDPDNPSALWLVAHVQEQIGGYDIAVKSLERARTLTNGDLPWLTHLGKAYALAGRRAEAEAIMDTLMVMSTRKYVPKDQIALLHAALGDTAQAFEWLEKAIDDYHWWMPNANAHPVWNGLNQHPRFKELMHQIGAKE